jgi:5-methylcytosine-specific restriction endonuclease McrA
MREPGQLTIRFALDHLSPKARQPVRDDFDLKNIVLACRSCNEVKGTMEIERFHQELASLGRALVAKYPQRG